MNEQKIIKAAIKATKAWREWHKPGYGSFPSHDVIEAMGELDTLIPGKNVKEICDEAEKSRRILK